MDVDPPSSFPLPGSDQEMQSVVEDLFPPSPPALRNDTPQPPSPSFQNASPMGSPSAPAPVTTYKGKGKGRAAPDVATARQQLAASGAAQEPTKRLLRPSAWGDFGDIDLDSDDIQENETRKRKESHVHDEDPSTSKRSRRSTEDDDFDTETKVRIVTRRPPTAPKDMDMDTDLDLEPDYTSFNPARRRMNFVRLGSVTAGANENPESNVPLDFTQLPGPSSTRARGGKAAKRRGGLR
ncbi:hypothetical protein M413DRAFT_30622 [Hebeloma cylindrosporum]|uniref:Uncharacterized protein n=1 Tax=Hebeloma cylindrosporum TaxID=76867 RepID=A0A0C3C239_HEBCY|nr:hypothetical protein M413DRAFT_30622 [Hebeloma cylindrosporum h7]